MKTYEQILKRRTIRRFLEKPINKGDVVDCINAARLAPSSANIQPLEYIVVTKHLEDLFRYTRWAGYLKDGAPKESERPTAYIIILSNTDLNKDAKYDVGLAAENIILTAMERGVASCLLGSIDREQLAKVFDIPEKYIIELVVALGYPAQRSFEEPFSGDVKYWLDDQCNLHVPKRTVKKILHDEKF